MKCHTALESFKLHGRFVPEDRALLAEQLLKDTKEALSVSEANAAAMRRASIQLLAVGPWREGNVSKWSRDLSRLNSSSICQRAL